MGRTLGADGLNTMGQISALLALEVDVEEGLVRPILHDLTGNVGQRVRAEISHQPAIRFELKSIDLPLIAFRIPIIGNAPDLAFRINLAPEPVLIESCLKQ